MNEGRIHRAYVSVILLSFLLLGCTSSSNLGLIEIGTGESTSGIIGDNLKTTLNLDTGSSLIVPANRITAGTEVTMIQVHPSDWSLSLPPSILTGPIYKITSEGDDLGFEGFLTLPIEDETLDGSQLEQVAIAYYETGKWISIPSSIDPESRSVSATLEHLSFYTWILRKSINRPPHVEVSVSPEIYSGIPPDAAQNLNLEDLNVNIYAVDPENKPVEVSVSLGFETVDSIGRNLMLELRESMGILLAIEASAISTIEGSTMAVDVATIFRNQAAPQSEDRMLMSREVVLQAPETANRFQAKINLRSLGLDLRSPLVVIHVLVKVTDDLEEAPILVDKTIDVIWNELPDAIQLTTPGPTSAIICPPSPVFQWSWPANADHARSFRFRLAKGDNLWGRRFTSADWVCSIEECDELGGRRNFFGTQWTPAEPLEDGTYSWGLRSSLEAEETSFESSTIVPSDIYQFTVDASLSGNQCQIIQKEEEASGEDQLTLVSIPPVEGMTGPQARDLLVSVGLSVFLEVPSEDCRQGDRVDGYYEALYAEPRAGTSVDVGTPIGLYVCWVSTTYIVQAGMYAEYIQTYEATEYLATGVGINEAPTGGVVGPYQTQGERLTYMRQGDDFWIESESWPPEDELRFTSVYIQHPYFLPPDQTEYGVWMTIAEDGSMSEFTVEATDTVYHLSDGEAVDAIGFFSDRHSGAPADCRYRLQEHRIFDAMTGIMLEWQLMMSVDPPPEFASSCHTLAPDHYSIQRIVLVDTDIPLGR